MSEGKAKKKFFKYSQKDLEDAVAAVRSSQMKIREAERTFNVPHSTLINKIKERFPMDRKMGPNTVISKNEENMLELFLISSAKKGFPVSKRRLVLLAQEISQRKLGRKWFELFLKRHPKISKRHAETINAARAAVTEQSIKAWHNNLRKYVEEEHENNVDLFEDPSRIINSDESGFVLNPKSGVVLGPKGEKNLYEIAPGSEKEQITVLLTISADGTIFPTVIVLPYERVPPRMAENYNPEWGFLHSKSGWMTSEAYLGFIQTSLLPALKAKGVKFPILYLVDGHKSHLSYDIAKFCSENGIIIYSLRPNATHILQPADVSVFRSLKHHWAEEVEDFKAKNKYIPITKVSFGRLLENSLSKVTADTVKAGFRRCGLFPFNADNIDFTKCMVDASRVDANFKPQLKSDFGYANLMYVESCMRHGRTREFRQTYESMADWDGDESAAELYKVWFKLRKTLDNKVTAQQETTTPEITQEENTIHDHIIPDETVLADNIQDETAERNTFQPSTYTHAEKVPADYTQDETTEQNTFQPNQPSTSTSVQDISPSFYKNVIWPEDTPPKKQRRVVKFPQGTGARKWLQYYEEQKQHKDEEEAKKLAKNEERKRKKDEKEKAKKKKKAKVLYEVSSSDDEVDKEVDNLRNSSGGEWDEEENNENEDVTEEMFWGGPIDTKIEDWVVVEFEGKKGPLHYVGRVLNRQTSNVEITFLKKKSGNNFIFPNVPDVASVNVDAVKKVLPSPHERRGYYSFPIKFPHTIVVV